MSTPATERRPTGATPRRVLTFRGEQTSIRALAELAGCTYAAMHYRLITHSPEVAVAMGECERTNNRRGMRVTRAQQDAAAHPLRKLAAGSKLAKMRDAVEAEFSGEVIVPAGVKRTVIAPPAPEPVPSVFGRIGQYLPDETHISRVYGSRKP